MPSLALTTLQRTEFVDITRGLQDLLLDQGWREGALLVFSPHTTAGLTLNEGTDPDVSRDIRVTLARLVPEEGDYRHGEGNADAHLKASLMGSSVMIPVQGGRLRLGIWQRVFFCEFDGPRSRSVHLSFLEQAR